MKKYLKILITRPLTQKEAYKCMLAIVTGKSSDIYISSFLTIYFSRKISLPELIGFRKAIYEHSLKIDFTSDTLDIVGTGGDKKNSFNISTTAAFIIAGAGIKVTKHGNFAVSSLCGSSNVLEFLGVKFSSNQNILKKQLEKTNFCYLHAPLFHQAMRHVAPVRQALGMETIFNLMGPLLNPCSPKYNMIGVYKKDILNLYSSFYKNNHKKYKIIFSLDGFDEISLTSDFLICDNNKTNTFSAKDFQLNSVKESSLIGKSIKDNSTIMINVLNNSATKEQENVVLANAAVALSLIYPNESFIDNFARAKESLRSENAKNCWNTFLNMSNI